ncbi:hypothetical protein Pfo_028439 [Paulownia fortunei]|nr:hypothetical protein Pfo_028439 [Paulownia fortunei]
MQNSSRENVINMRQARISPSKPNSTSRAEGQHSPIILVFPPPKSNNQLPCPYQKSERQWKKTAVNILIQEAKSAITNAWHYPGDY